MKKLMLTLIVSIFMLSGVSVFAADSTSSVVQNKIDTTQIRSDIDKSIDVQASGEVKFTKAPTIDQVTSKGEKKGYEIVKSLQRVSQPFSIILFILGLVMFIFGTATGSKVKATGLSLVVMAPLVYFGILFSQDILDFFIEWLKAE